MPHHTSIQRFSYPWRHSPLDVKQVLNSFAIIVYIIRLYYCPIALC